MLTLSRRRDESVIITGLSGERIEVKVASIRDGKVYICFDAPKDVRIHRKEVQDKVDEDRVR